MSEESKETRIRNVAEAIEEGRARQVAGLVKDALDEGCRPVSILEDGMVDAMSVVGERFKKGEIFVPEMLVAARAMKKGVDALKPYMPSGGGQTKGKMVLGTVAGDLHDIGKNLVGMMVESAGFEVIDLGIDVPIEKFIEACEENPDVKIVGCSALLTTTMDSLRETVAALNAQPFRSRIKVIVGGAPVTAEFAKEIGADGYSEDAGSAAQLVTQLVTEMMIKEPE